MRTVLPIILLVIFPLMTNGQSCPAECTSCDNGLANCLGVGIRDIPKNFPTTITILDVSNNQLTELSSNSFQELPSLQTLRMSGNGISEVMERSFTNLPSLMSIDLSNNPVRWIHDDALMGMAYLRMLSIQTTKLRKLGKMMSDAPSLHTVNLASNQIEAIEDENFESNRQLQILDLSQNRISKVSAKAFANLDRLRYLNMNSNPIVSLPELEFGSSILQLVDFTNCQLEEVPGKMPASVADFRLGNNKLKQIRAESFENITNLRLVTLNNNEITQVEEKAFGTIERLMEIWLSYNKLKSVPRLLPRNLNKLFLDHNEIYEIGARNFPINSQLELLTLDTNKVERISDAAWVEMPKLKRINLNANKIKVMTSGSFTNIPSLECLRLSNNPIAVIEDGAMSNLPKLNEISLSYLNALKTTIPSDFISTLSTVENINMMNSPGLVKSFMELTKQKSEEMPNTKVFSLQYNELESLPSNLQRALPNIQKLFLDGNPWHCDKNLIWLKDWMTSNDITFYNYEPLVCTAPKDVEGKEITSLRNSQFGDAKPTQSAPVEDNHGAGNEVQDNNRETTDVDNKKQNPVPNNSDQREITPTKNDAQNVRTVNVNVVGSAVSIGHTDANGNDDDEEDNVEKQKKPKKNKKKKNKNKKNKNKKNKNKKKRNKKNKRDRTKRKNNKANKRCIIDPNGKKICPRRVRRCTVEADGKRVCKRNRRGRKKGKKAETSSSPPIQG